MTDDVTMLEELCEIVRCPVTGSRVRPVTAERLASVNRSVVARRLFHHNGTVVEREVSSGLETVDAKYLYVVKDGIALLMAGYAVNLDETAPAPVAAGLRSEKQSMQSFYDEVGWAKGDAGDFEDALIWEDLRPVSARYIHDCHVRVNRSLGERGRFLLDAASGPVQYPEYLTYSEKYHRRVCVDISFRALVEAKRKLGDRGLYVLGDITNLPFLDGSMDAIVSLHTIYHVPADEQGKAVTELYRVLAPGRSGVIVYNWYESVLTRLLMKPAPAIQNVKNFFKRRVGRDGSSSPAAAGGAPVKEPPYIYFHSHPRKWFLAQGWSFPVEFRVWRALSVPCMRTWIRPNGLGRATLKALYWLENRLPHFFGKYGEYPMIVLRKP